MPYAANKGIQGNYYLIRTSFLALCETVLISESPYSETDQLSRRISLATLMTSAQRWTQRQRRRRHCLPQGTYVGISGGPVLAWSGEIRFYLLGRSLESVDAFERLKSCLPLFNNVGLPSFDAKLSLMVDASQIGAVFNQGEADHRQHLAFFSKNSSCPSPSPTPVKAAESTSTQAA